MLVQRVVFQELIVLMKLVVLIFSSSKPTHSAMNSGTKPMAAPTRIF